MADLYLAVDLGAGSGRVFLARLAQDEFTLEEIRRFHYAPVMSEGHLRWAFAHILSAIEAGLRDAGARAKAEGATIYSVGVDSWGVDYGWLDAQGKLIADPICYRDARTAGVMEKIWARMSREEIFRRTGLQFMPLNTLYQIAAGTRPANAAKLLLMPDLVNFFLTGRALTEYTNATTTQMLNAVSRQWDAELLQQIDLPAHLLAEIVAPGTEVGPLKPSLANAAGLAGTRVIAPATHDTGSAVAGAPLADNWAFISSGTWSLVGLERRAPLINDEVLRHNFTNEGGVYGTFRLLKNVMGLWLLEACRREWQAAGQPVEYAALLREVEAIEGFPALIYPDDPRFFNPASMLAAIQTQIAETGQSLVSDTPACLAKVILDSLALRYASVLHTLEKLTQRHIAGVQIVGGGSLNAYLNQKTADFFGVPVIAGPTEATVIGNVMVQAIAAGRFRSLSEARWFVAQNVELQEFEPQETPAVKFARQRFAKIAARYEVI